MIDRHVTRLVPFFAVRANVYVTRMQGLPTPSYKSITELLKRATRKVLQSRVAIRVTVIDWREYFFTIIYQRYIYDRLDI